VYSPLETAANGGIELPGDIGCAKNQHALAVLPHSVHLHQHFGFYPPRRFGFTFTSGAAKSVDLVDEDD
jgi:hypothetical protein